MTDHTHPSDIAKRQRPCTATTAAGQPCRGWALDGSDHCLSHQQPGEAGYARHREYAAKGGRNHVRFAKSAREVLTLPDACDLTTPQGIRQALAAALQHIISGPIDTPAAHAIAALARCQLAAVDSAELAARLERVEAMLSHINKPRRVG
jgi:hypothetical protein